MPLRVAVIVEGHGEVDAAPILIRRIWTELLGSDDPIDILTPNRDSQGKLLGEDGLKKKVLECHKRLAQRKDGYHGLILILIDTEKRGCPKDQAPQLLAWAKEARSDADIACVMPNPMLETWFAASASSLAGYNGLPNPLPTPENPEGKRLGKAWLKRLFVNPRKYSETVDAPKLAARVNLTDCRKNSASFDKLRRELESRLPPIAPPPPPTRSDVDPPPAE